MNVFQFCYIIKDCPFEKAVQIITGWYLINREWEPDERYSLVSNALIMQITSLIKEGIDSGKVTGKFDGDVVEDDDGESYNITYYEKSSINLESLFKFILYKLDKKEFAAPDKFIALLKGETSIDDKKLTVLQQAKQLVQAVAMTLWEIFPDMKAEEMKKHKAILEYAGGKNYPGKNTLSDWLREVDTRPSETKTGPKKKDTPVS